MASFMDIPEPEPVFWLQLAIVGLQWVDARPACIPIVARATATPVVADWCELGKSWLLSQFVGEPRIEAILCIILDQCQTLEQVVAEVQQLIRIDTAFGVQLDLIGALMGLERVAFETDDEDYRLALYTFAKTSISKGHPDELIEIAQEYLNGRSLLTYTESYPESLRIEVTSQVLDYDQGHRMAQLIRPAIPVTVDYALMYRPLGLKIITFDDDTIHTLVNLAEEGVPNSGGVLSEEDPGGPEI